MTIANDLFNQALAHQECYRAGVVAGDASGTSARKLAMLLGSANEALGELQAMLDSGDRHPNVMLAYATLRTAIDQARE